MNRILKVMLATTLLYCPVKSYAASVIYYAKAKASVARVKLVTEPF